MVEGSGVLAGSSPVNSKSSSRAPNLMGQVPTGSYGNEELTEGLEEVGDTTEEEIEAGRRSSGASLGRRRCASREERRVVQVGAGVQGRLV
jgi:hypothetical protein